MKYYTNGAYLIRGFEFKGTITGKVIKSKHPMVYKVGERINVPLRHLSTGEIQFHRLKGSLLKLEMKRTY